MRVKVIVLVTAALAPPVVLAYGLLPIAMSDTFSNAFCLCSGLSWCVLFGVILARSSRQHRRRLLLLSPMALFAFVFPVFGLFLWLGFLRATLNGSPPL